MMRDKSSWYLLIAIVIGLAVGRFIKHIGIGMLFALLVGFVIMLAKPRK